MVRKSIWVGAMFLFLACIFMTPRASGQAVYGSISGTVTDAQGAGVAGAKVTVTDLSKGTVEEASTNESGNYSVTHLIPDNYKIRIEAPGFKAYEIASVRVDADTAVRADGQLQVGAVTQSVEVTGEIPQLQTEKTDVATIFSTQEVESVPIFNRNFTTFQLLSPGAQIQGWGHAASENPQGSRQILTNGQHFAGTGFELDGTDNQDPILGIIVINPNLDSINEVKITSQDYDAEFGRAIGAIVTSQTKSGTNEIHGSAFDFERSNSNFASDPFSQTPSKIAAGQRQVPSGNWNQFGGTIGGPIRKNKIFAFGDYQGQRAHVGGTAQDRILTAAERGGDLSDLGRNIYDPYVTSDPAHCNVVPNAAGQPTPAGLATRTQFPGNVIPACRLSQQVQSLLSKVNFPTGATLSDPTANNFSGSGSNVLNADNFDVRGDYVLNSRTQVFGRYSYQKFLRSGPGLFGLIAGGPALPADSGGQFSGTSNVRNQSLATGFDYTFSPTLLTDFRFGYMRYHVDVAPGGLGTTPATDAGIPGLNIDTRYTTGMPYFHVTTPGLPDFNFGYSLGANQCNCPLLESEHQYQFVNNWTKIRGNHTFKFGADIRYAYNLRVPSDVHRAGELTFDNSSTQGQIPDPKNPGKFLTVGGSGLAAFLLGDVVSFGRYVSSSTNANETQPRLFFFGQDTWRVNNKLSVNLGLRWEIYEPESVRGTGQGGWVDWTTGEVRIAGQNGVDLRGNTSTSYTHFAPRLGIAYQWNPKTVVRLGYGRSYDIGVFGSIFGHAVTQNLPVLASQSISTSTTQTRQDFNTAFFLSKGPVLLNPATALASGNCNSITDPTGTKTQCLGPNGRPLLPDGINAFVRPFSNRLPTVDAWNATVQRQVTSTISMTVAYVGNKGTHTIGGGPDYPFNNARLAGYDPTLSGDAATLNNNLRKPFYSKYGWTDGFRYFGNDFNNHYNALQVTAEKRFASGLSFNANYTFQHAKADLDGGTAGYDKSVNYGPNDNYRNHVFIFTQVYQLPFGTGKRWANNVGRLGDLLVGGWELNGTTNWSSGLPFTPGLSTCHPSSDTGPCRPDLVGSVKDGRRSGDPNVPGYWFQTTAGVALDAAGKASGSWAQPAVDTFGNVGRNSLRGPRYFDSDLALFKNFTITERAKAQFQFQFYNIFNHVNLANPDGCVDCLSSGVNTGGKITGIAANSQLRSLTYGFKLSF
jgi:outer membrane receptor protein involved in Fe transport